MRAQKVKQLLESGVSTKLLSTLSDNQINSLYKRMVSEVTMVSKDDSETIKKMQNEKKPYEVYEDDNLDAAVDKDSGYDPYAGNSISNDKGPSSNDGDNNADDGMGMMEAKGKSKKNEQNPWAICTAQLGKEFKTRERSEWSPKQMAKYERCVKDVKESLKESKKPLVSLIENEIMSMVEKHVAPKITKRDLLKQIKEGDIIRRELKKSVSPTNTKKMDKPVGKSYTSKKDMMEEPAAPVKTPTKPGVKPKKPSPYQPPKETPKEAPKAEDLKKMFMQTLTSMFNK